MAGGILTPEQEQQLLTAEQRAPIERKRANGVRVRVTVPGAVLGPPLHGARAVMMHWRGPGGAARQQLVLANGHLGPVSGDERTYR